MVHQRWRRAVDRIVFFGLDRPALVHRVPGHIEHPSHNTLTDRDGDGPAGIRDLKPRLRPSVPDMEMVLTHIIPEMLLNFEYQFDGLAVHVVLNGQCVVNRREFCGNSTSTTGPTT